MIGSSYVGRNPLLAGCQRPTPPIPPSSAFEIFTTDSFGAPVGSGFMPLDGAVGGPEHMEPRPHGPHGHVRIVPGADLPPHHAVVVRLGLPAAEGPVRGVPVDPDVVPVLDPEGLRVEGVDVHVPLAHVGHPAG